MRRTKDPDIVRTKEHPEASVRHIVRGVARRGHRDGGRLGTSLDLGDRPTLARYERKRRFDNVLMLAATDGLNRLFSNDIAPVRLARDLGLAVVDRMPLVKRLFMRQAMGTLGPLPRLARGEPL